MVLTCDCNKYNCVYDDKRRFNERITTGNYKYEIARKLFFLDMIENGDHRCESCIENNYHKVLDKIYKKCI